MEIIEKDINELKFLKENPRVNLNEKDIEFQQLVESISYFGLQMPLLINKDNVVLAGNLMLKALKYLHWEKVPCIITSVNPSKEIFLNIALNKIKGDWHILRLKDLVAGDKVSINNLVAIGFTNPEIDALKLIDEFPKIKTETKRVKNELTLFE